METATEINTEQVKEVRESKMINMMELEGDIKHAIGRVSINKKDLKKKTEEIKQRLLANSSYALANDELKTAQKNRSEAKKKAMREDEVLAKLDNEKKVMQADTKQWQLTLSDYLRDFVEETKQKAVSDDQGNLLDIEANYTIKIQ